MIHCELSANLSYAKLNTPVTLDDFVGLFLVSVYPGTAPDWLIVAAGNSADRVMLNFDNGNVELGWDSGRNTIANAGGSIPSNAVTLVRVARQQGVWSLDWTGYVGNAPAITCENPNEPITFDMFGATGLNDYPIYSTPGCHVLKASILPGHPTAEDVARVEVGMAGYQLS